MSSSRIEGEYTAPDTSFGPRWRDPITGHLYSGECATEIKQRGPGTKQADGTVKYDHLVWVPRVQPLATESNQAFKADAGKPRFDLLMDGMPDALLDVAKVLTWAIEVKGYKPHSWKEVPDAKRRYLAALHRHDNAMSRGEVNDPESGLPHAAHRACCVLFLAQLDYIKE